MVDARRVVQPISNSRPNMRAGAARYTSTSVSIFISRTIASSEKAPLPKRWVFFSRAEAIFDTPGSESRDSILKQVNLGRKTIRIRTEEPGKHNNRRRGWVSTSLRVCRTWHVAAARRQFHVQRLTPTPTSLIRLGRDATIHPSMK
jgi:hypothetical protein